MRTGSVCAAVAGGFILVALLNAPSHGQEKRAFGSPPRSLDKYYPPNDQSRAYTIEMLELGRLLGSLRIGVRDLSNGDGSKVALGVTQFLAQFEKVAGMVPEWKPYFPAPTVAMMKKLIAEPKDGARAEALVKEIEGSCSNCHVREMFKVQAFYNWPRFAEVTVPARDGREVPFHDTMVEISNQMGALTTAVERSDFSGAKGHQKELLAQFEMLETSCERCHAEPRAYFVDRRVKAEILKMGVMVKQNQSDPKVYKKLTDSIQRQSCIPCHQLHMPAAFVQLQFYDRPPTASPPGK